MAPDFDKKREARRLGHLGHIGADVDKGMLLMRCPINPLTDYYRHGNTGGGSAANSAQRASLAANTRQTTPRRFTQARSSQQSQQSVIQQQSSISQTSQRQHTSPARIPLASIAGVTVRNTDEHGPNSTQEVCDNSNDSGLGFEDRQQHITNPSAWNNGTAGEEDTKRRKMDIKLESEDANFAFPERTGENHGKITRNNNTNGIVAPVSATRTSNGIGRVGGVMRARSTIGSYGKRPPPAHQGSVSRDGKVQLQIICQPEQQHRARYQTEGSRGAVKDRTGNGFPIVRLVGYDKPATLQVFIGTDLGRVAPHMFYQACRVSGKNSTPCVERKIDGTIVIEVDMDPAKDMLVTCDCVGILKERNVDVEHRFPQEAGMLQGRSKKKSTKCRMVFRTTITHTDGTTETLQVCSQPIVCTQPPGIPEISKKSLTACPCTGGLELFILGKNFLKDTRMVFQLDNEDITSSLEPHWECSVTPDKEFLQQTHLICVVPPYRRQDLNPSERVCVKLYAVSSGKTSEPHTFFYTSITSPPEPTIGKIEASSTSLVTSPDSTSPSVPISPIAPSTAISPVAGIPTTFLSPQINNQQQSPLQQSQDVLKNDPSPPRSSTPVTPIMMWAAQANNSNDVMMPPPNLVSNPLLSRRSSSNHQLILPDNLKSEILDDTSESSMLSDNSLQGNNTPPSNGTSTSPLHALVSENSREASQPGLMHSAQEVGLLGVDLIHHQHPLALAGQSFPIHEATQVKVLSPHHINKEASPIHPQETTAQGTSVVDLRMKQHEYDTLNTFTSTPADQALPNQSSQSIAKYLNQIEISVPQSKEPEATEQELGTMTQLCTEPTFETMQQRATIIANARQQSEAATILANQTAKLDELVNSVVDSHQTPMQTTPSPPTSLIPEVDTTRTSPPIPVKTMLLGALMPTPMVTSSVAPVTPTPEPSPEETLLTTINALHPAMETPIVTAAGISNATVSIASHNPLQVTSEPLPQIQTLTPQEVVVQQQVEQVFAEAQKQVEEVVAQVQQQAANTVHEAQNQVVRQVVECTQVVREAMKQVHAARHVQAVPHVEEVVKQATASVVKRAVKETTEGVVKQVQVVQKAIGHAQAAQVMKQAVQNDIGSMLNQPAGFVAEASSALASGAAQEPNQQRLTNAAEQAISNVITNATQDIMNNRPITTTTAHAIIATKNIMNSVATQSAQLMNSAMEGILPQSPSNATGGIVEQVARKSPEAIPVPPTMQNGETPMQVQVTTTNGQVPGVVKKPEDAGGMLPQELTSMSEHDLLSYINPSCFDQGTFLM
ncbi:nuclear factor of activated T-cells 5 isoform X2 [Fopius arisanus]|uniref:Nuclear factor of activated T-cells 5 isoform X2 n=1 Tax=Fopius arisanus TaxID=64838 RepID=A0A9R1SXU6_9HYME|nr:PREDICTED: nuclear factor of activated T-cells 5 isoform X2 [Fopius arisanus]